MAMRKIRNQMVHDDIEDLEVPASALLTGPISVPARIATANAVVAEAEERGWT